MRHFIELIKEDPGEFIGGIACWCGLLFIAFMLFVIL